MKYLLKPIVMGFLLASAVPSVTLASNNNVFLCIHINSSLISANLLV